MDTLFDDAVDEIDRIVKLLQQTTVVDTRGRPKPWPADDEKDRILISKLMAQYPQFTYERYEEELPRLSAWMLDMTVKKGINVRARVHTWVSNCNTPRRGSRTQAARHGRDARHGGTRAGGAPSRVDEFGPSGFTTF